ncbi:hypothetical protein [Nocardia sp. NPDC057030]|uniref:hypothetical protein n=1 Tax=unclassified Nocardia TaxID=2637762 RepID=UPI00363DCB6D
MRTAEWSYSVLGDAARGGEAEADPERAASSGRVRPASWPTGTAAIEKAVGIAGQCAARMGR